MIFMLGVTGTRQMVSKLVKKRDRPSCTFGFYFTVRRDRV